MFVETTCKKCGTIINLDIGDLNKEESKKELYKMNEQIRDCPGFHVEFGGWYDMWNIEEAINKAFDNNTFKEIKIISDEEFIQKHIDRGAIILDGGQNTVPQFNLKSIHDLKNLKHIGFGSFQNEEYNFDRIESDNNTRFYIQSKRLHY